MQLWTVWRWEKRPSGDWSKPHYQVRSPQYKVSTDKPENWCDHAAAAAAVAAGHGHGIGFVLTPDCGLAVLDLDDCRDPKTGDVTDWAQAILERAQHAYVEVSPSGSGFRIIGGAAGTRVHTNTAMPGGSKLEIWRGTSKAVTVTGLDQGYGSEIVNIDKLVDWSVKYAERMRPEPVSTPMQEFKPNGAGRGLPYTVDQIEHIVSTGAPPGADRSALFFSIVGHYAGCGWNQLKIIKHLAQHPDGIGAKYIAEERLTDQVIKCLRKLKRRELPAAFTENQRGGATVWERPEMAVFHEQPPWEEKAPAAPAAEAAKQADPEVDEDPAEDVSEDAAEADPPPNRKKSKLAAHRIGIRGRMTRRWLVKNLLGESSVAALAGQWGIYKTFLAMDLCGCVMYGAPFCGYTISRRVGVWWLAYEGANEVEPRMTGLLLKKYNIKDAQSAPFVWSSDLPLLLREGTGEDLLLKGREIDADFQQDFGLSLGLIVVDTLTSGAGYTKAGDENDPAVFEAIKRQFAGLAQRLNCCVLFIDHFGKDETAGMRGTSAKEAGVDSTLVSLGRRSTEGVVTESRLAARKVRGASVGAIFRFGTEKVDLPEPDEDGEVESTLVINWTSGAAPEAAAPPAAPDPWDHYPDLKAALAATLTAHGELRELECGTEVRAAKAELVEAAFKKRLVEVSPDARRKRWKRHVSDAREDELIGSTTFEDAGEYVWFTRQQGTSGHGHGHESP
jgi:hypothetical protein